MKKDISQPALEDFLLAVVPRPETGEEDELELWDVWMVNLKEEPIRNILVACKGYGKRDGERIETTTLRYFFEQLHGRTAHKIEPIQATLFDLSNEYWVSFRYDGHMFDKKYVFVSDSIHREHFTEIPLMNQQGVMIR